ncbi:MAG: 4Fe-4S binding protein [Desulfobacterales bacterium]|jgi:ferredoxin|nr:4Fe-4S binding protein [Desulfobacterales bacterium]
MTLITTRRITQIFFFGLFIWFCIVSTPGTHWWQLRGWPVNWFLQLDPLVGLGVLLTTHTLYAGLLWGMTTLVLTLFLGRFFCGWVCPMGALQQFVGYLGQRKQKTSDRVSVNQPHRAQRIKYWLLVFLLAAAAADLLHFLLAAPLQHTVFFWTLVLLVAVWAAVMTAFNYLQVKPKTILWVVGLLAASVALQWCVDDSSLFLATTLQTGLLDPIVLIHRSVNLVILPLLDAPVQITAVNPRLYQGGGVIGVFFLTVLLLCLRVPRFYCRFICPLGALLGLFSRWSVWRIGKSENHCRQCRQCEAHCEGACAPSGVIQISECVLCLNCMDQCRHGLMGYRAKPSAAGEALVPDLSRRQVISALVSGLALAPVLRIDGMLAGNWNPKLIRPPGALPEADFLSRCIKCGQCMRICPTNVIHPAGWQAGLEGLWTPVLNFRIGTSGCQHNCVACSHVCPTAALRPMTVGERMGRDRFTVNGPIRTGMAFVDRGRCLPWAMDTPCIVCQENCPVSPKAIFTRTEYRPVRDGQGVVQSAEGTTIEIAGIQWSDRNLAGGDFFLRWGNAAPERIVAVTAPRVTLAATKKETLLPETGDICRIEVRLQQPYIDPQRCIGCGVCEHECPVQGQRAVRVSAENESRHARYQMVVSYQGELK